MAQINNIYSARDGAYSTQAATLQTSILPLMTPNAYNRYPSGRPRFSDQPPGANHLSATGKGILIGMLSAFGSAILIVIILVLVYLLGYTNRGRIFLDRIGRPGEYDDEQQFLKEETEALEQMDDIQRSEYLRAKGEIRVSADLWPMLTYISVYPSKSTRVFTDRYLIVAVSGYPREGCISMGI